MKPIRLELTGLNSYTDKQIVDFEKLTERGLFGIFGNTGSGKSTILDAITIAMYGNIARNTKEYINSSCDKAIITYEFEIGSKNAKRRYVVDRTIERTKTGTKTSHARLVEIHNDGTQVVLADKVGDVNDKVTQVVGLTADDFTRSVVLPQGKFNDFLKLTGSERRDMLERIFNLEKYGRGLIDKVRKRKSIQIQSLRDINSKLSQYDGISVELYDDTVKELGALKIREKEKTNELEYEQKKYEEFKIIYEEQIKLEKVEARKKELDLKRNDINDKTKQLENSINAEKIHPYITSLQSLEKDIADANTKIVNIDKDISMLGQELSITKIKAEESYNLRNERLPKLSEEKGKLERARSQEIELTSLDEELKEVKEKGKVLNKEKDVSAVVLKDNESKREILAKKIKEIEHKIDKLIISADLKQKIYLAYDYEKQYNNLSEEKKINNNKLELLNKEFDEINLKSKYILRDKEIISKKLAEENNKFDLLLKKCPGKNEDILLKTEQLIELKSKAEMLKENEIKKEKIQNELNIILEQKHSTDRELNIVQEKLESNKKNIIDLEKEVERLKYLNLALELKKELKENMPCPVCGSRHHENSIFEKNDDRLEFEKSKLEKLYKEESEIKNKIEALNSRNSEIVSIEKIKVKEMDELKHKLGEKKSSELSKKYEEEQRKLEVLKNNVHRWEKEKLENEENISRYKEEKNKIEKEEIKVEESINNYRKTISTLKETIEDISAKYKEIKEKYIGLKSITRVSDLEGKVLEINKNEKIIEELNKQYSSISKQKDELEASIRNIQSQLHQIELELISATEVYAEKRKARDEKYNEVMAITKGELAQNLLDNIELEINKIVTHEEHIKIKLEEQRVGYDKYIAEKNNVEGRLKIARDQYQLQSDILEQLLRESKFDGIYSVKRSLLDPDYKRRLGEEITEYEEEQKILTFKYKELIDKLNGRRIKNEDFESLKNKLYNLKVEIGNIAKEIGAKQSTIETIKDSLEKVKALSKELRNIQHKVDLLEDLDKIIQGNRFVEYVATNQLKYIALEASKRLEDITKGRYALEIDSTLNFVMRDNFNGGLRRSVDTLSGGETFLTSLSLALALSSQIQLKGNAPLEFFFLDEGFGSLDSDLLEIVMQSLERLQSDKLSVGIISHVEELKNRVPVKLIVMPSEAGSGSKVNIEYS